MSFDASQIGLAALVCATLVIAWAVYWDFRKKQLMFEERRAAIENGMTPPPLPAKQLDGWPGVRQRELELKAEERRLMIERGIPWQDEQKQPKTRQDYLRRGLVASCVGAGALVAYVVLGIEPLRADGVADARAWCAGLGPVILLYGVALLIFQRFATEPPPPASPGPKPPTNAA